MPTEDKALLRTRYSGASARSDARHFRTAGTSDALASSQRKRQDCYVVLFIVMHEPARAAGSATKRYYTLV